MHSSSSGRATAGPGEPVDVPPTATPNLEDEFIVIHKGKQVICTA